MHDSPYKLVVPFLTDDPVYAHGVEFGMIYVKLAHGKEDRIDEFALIDNQEQILLAANRLGWRVTKMEDSASGWFYIRLER